MGRIIEYSGADKMTQSSIRQGAAMTHPRVGVRRHIGVISVWFYFWSLWLLVGPVWAGEALILAVSRSPLSLPFYVADQEGFFAAEGVTVKFDEVIGGHRSMQQVLEGKADLGTCSEAVIMFNSFTRDDFAILASFVTSKDDVKVVVRADSGIARPGQLAQKRIGTIIGSASHYYLDTLLVLNGVDPKGVKLISMQPEAMAGALNAKAVDAVAAWQPFPYRIEREVDGARSLMDGGFYTLSFNLVAARNLLGRRDDDLVRVLRALARAQGLIAKAPQRAQAILRNKLQLDQAYIDWQWPRYHYRLSLDQALLTTLESEARWSRGEGYVVAKRSPNFLGFMYSGPLKRVDPAAVGLIE